MKNTLLLRFQQSLRKDWLRKLIALFFAILIYFAGSQHISEEDTWEDVPVEVSLPPGLIDTNPKPIRVNVRVRGSKRNLKNRSKLSGHVQVRERDFVSGEPYRLTIKPEDFTPVKGIRVTGVEAGDATRLLALQRQMTRQVPVRAVFTGELSADFIRTDAACTPQSVDVTGPENLVQDLKDVVTEPIPLDSSVTEPFSYVAKLRNPNGLVIGAKNDSVQVRVSVERNITEKEFLNIPLQVQYTAGRPLRSYFSADVKVDVIVRGPLKAVSALDPRTIHPIINLADGVAGKRSKLKIEGYVAVEGVEIKTVKPSHIEVEIIK
ncbi:MAG: YbbR-like domain-containing protein [Lentisphaeria bacterium]|nr:YbbR-like domain-containing protein [Lentisphaeria bacterium]